MPAEASEIIFILFFYLLYQAESVRQLTDGEGWPNTQKRGKVKRIFMKKQENNYAYIDGANLHKGIQELGWKLNYWRFRVWLKEKYGVTSAYIFLGLIPKHKDLYTNLQEAGFTLVFKETTYDNDGKAKGNCDADLVLKAAVDYFEKNFNKAVLVSSDGDYACLVQFLKEKGVLFSIVSPGNKCSFLLRKLNVPLVYLDTQKSRLKYGP